jgi:hypothetical protein
MALLNEHYARREELRYDVAHGVALGIWVAVSGLAWVAGAAYLLWRFL